MPVNLLETERYINFNIIIIYYYYYYDSYNNVAVPYQPMYEIYVI